MILQALTQYYEALVAQGKLEGPGWAPVKVHYALTIDEGGALVRVVSVQTEQMRGKKPVLAPRVLSLPAPVKRTVNDAANFLCDNSGYMLGIDEKGKPERTRRCFKDCKALHHAVLDGVDSPAARAVLAFFDNWNPDAAREHPALADHLDAILAGANLIFRYRGAFVHEDEAISKAWARHYGDDADGPKGVCLVTGEYGAVESVHPAIKNVVGAQSSGAALVSFNAPAFCSYGKKQNLNAPTGKYAAFAYTSALNHLLADREHVNRIGDDTVVCWAENGSAAYQDLSNDFIFDAPYSDEDIAKTVSSLCRGESVEYHEEQLDPNMTFYVKGIAPNAARLSVRIFLRNTFGNLLRNVQAHHERMEIIRPSFDKYKTLPVWKMLDETVNPKSREKKPSNEMSGDVLRAILSNTRYPATLLNGVILRVRAERDITRGRTAIVKAYYIKEAEAAGRENPDIPKEVLQVSLNSECTHVPYTLGRLFSVLEDIQLAANQGINTTIKDSYFNSAATTPAVVFPRLIMLAQKHLKKVSKSNKGRAVNMDKQLTELLAILGEHFPNRLNLAQQGSFLLGYYHQTQERYTKKEDKDNA